MTADDAPTEAAEVEQSPPGYFAALLAAGKCPGCAGTGRVERFVPAADVYPCSTCGGDGRWPPVEWRASEGPE